VAHCDLQHGNILVKGDSIKLVDYDGMFVPTMAGQGSNELGHPNYQHIKRCEKDFGNNLDNFSAWLIHYSLLLLKLDPSFWRRYSGGDDCLLFRKADFMQPQQSRLLKEIAEHQVPDIRALHRPITNLLSCEFSQVPAFGFEPGGNTAGGAIANQLVTSTIDASGLRKKPLENPIYSKIWPRSEQYFSSLLRPGKSFSDEKLADSVPMPTAGKTSQDLAVDATTEERLTVQKTIILGRRNAVARMATRDGSKQYAVKFFFHNLGDRYLRYDTIHRFKKNASNRYFVPFVYQPKGVLVGEEWFPVLKMLWVNGSSLEDYVIDQLRTGYPEAVQALLPKFEEMIRALTTDGIAHGDLEPRNILVDETGNLKIVDYDAMYVPALANLSSCETGHQDYQHPGRKPVNYGPYLDNFSAIQIYGMLRCLSANAPQKYWDWKALAQTLSGPTGQDPKARAENKKSQGWLLGQSSAEGGMGMAMRLDPKFEKASEVDTPAGDGFEATRQRLTKVLKEQRMRRIDQVDALNMLVWRLI
jgi:hypothetical protein